MKKWCEKTTLEKVAEIISAIAFCVWIVFEIIDARGNVEWAGIATRWSIIVICIFQCICYWNEKRIISYIAIGGLVCFLAIFALEFTQLA